MGKIEGGWGGLFVCARACVRILYPARAVPEGKVLPAPCVFVCRHKDLSGPIRTMLWMPGPLRPWVYHVFCERESCYLQFRDYTLTARLGWPRFWACPVARLISFLLPVLLRSMRAIPVHRASLKVAATFRASIDALCSGERLILYPDIDYTDTSATVGELYSGYALLSSLYARKAGRALPFVPIAVRDRSILRGDPIFAEKDEAREALGERIRLALQALEA